MTELVPGEAEEQDFISVSPEFELEGEEGLKEPEPEIDVRTDPFRPSASLKPDAD
jgi:hypothetical protein